MHINIFIQLVLTFLLIAACSKIELDSQPNAEVTELNYIFGKQDDFEEFKSLIENEDTPLDKIEEFLDDVDDLKALYEYHEDMCGLIHYAAAQGEIEIANLLIDSGVPIDSKSELGKTALHFAVEKGYKELAKNLLEKSPNLLYQQDLNGNTPLHLAIISRYFDLSMFLSDKYQDTGKLAVKDTYGYTVLHLAAAEGAYKLALALLKRNPDIIDLQNIDGDTALHMAVLEDRLKLVELLLNNGADYNIKNYDGTTALDLAKDPELASQPNNREIITTLEKAVNKNEQKD
jgi:ankyrin repeat protein